MKRIISLVLLLSVCALVLASCGGGSTEKEYTLAIGVQVTDELDEAKVSETVATVVADKDGKIVACRIDAIDFAAELKDGSVVVNAPVSKAEKGDGYGMVAWGGAKAEWYAQAEAFETYVVGKTLAEVKAIALGADGKPTDTELTAGCTIAVTDFVLAIEKAFASTKKVNFKADGDIKAGVSAKGAIDDDGNYVVDFAGVVTVDNTVVAAIIDSTSVTASVSVTDGALTATASTYKGTKLELGDDYGMVAWGGAKAEWYTQAQTFANTAVGKTVSQVSSLATEGIAGCTIDVEGYKVALVAAAGFVR